MILTKSEIIKQLLLGKIYIDPFNEAMLNPNSYNYRIDNVLYEVISNPIDVKQKVKFQKHLIPAEGFVLHPKKLYLSNMLEKIGSDQFVISLIGRSSVGRLGMFLQITADLGQLGSNHSWTLELTVVQPLKIYPYMRIGQISFWKTTGKRNLQYNGEYGNYSKPMISRIYKELSL